LRQWVLLAFQCTAQRFCMTNLTVPWPVNHFTILFEARKKINGFRLVCIWSTSSYFVSLRYSLILSSHWLTGLNFCFVLRSSTETFYVFTITLFTANRVMNYETLKSSKLLHYPTFQVSNIRVTSYSHLRSSHSRHTGTTTERTEQSF
jgi:hypothetical protein